MRRFSPAPLVEREFRLLFVVRTVSSLGSAVAPVGLAFAVLDLTGSKADLGYVLAARSVPTVVFILFGGVWADAVLFSHGVRTIRRRDVGEEHLVVSTSV